MLQECYGGVRGVLNTCYRDVTVVFRSVTGVLQECCSGVTGVLNGCYWVASGVLKECFRGVTEMLHGCFRIVTGFYRGCRSVIKCKVCEAT